MQRTNRVGLATLVTVPFIGIMATSAAASEPQVCTVNIARAAANAGDYGALCGCSHVTPGFVSYLQKRSDFETVLQNTSQQCLGLTALLTDLPTASIAAANAGEDRNSDGPGGASTSGGGGGTNGGTGGGSGGGGAPGNGDTPGDGGGNPGNGGETPGKGGDKPGKGGGKGGDKGGKGGGKGGHGGDKGGKGGGKGGHGSDKGGKGGHGGDKGGKGSGKGKR